MPVYLVTATELESGPRTFKHPSDDALRRGEHFSNRPHEDAPLKTYVVKRVTPDPTGAYDGLIDADNLIGGKEYMGGYEAL